MSRRNRSILAFSICILVVASYFVFVQMKDDFKEIEKEILAFNQPMAAVTHVEMLENNKAIAFYGWGHESKEYFGIAMLKKGLFGWSFRGGSTSQTPDQYEIGWSLSLLKEEFPEYQHMLHGIILNSDIETIEVISENKQKDMAEIVEYEPGDRFWYYISRENDLSESAVIARSQGGEIIEQLP